METRKINEANECIKKAEKHMSTSFLKWKPEYDLAATEYQNAATAFQTIKYYKESRECLMKAAECHQRGGAHFSAGKCYEKGALLSRDLEDWNSVESLASRACSLFQEHGVPDTAAITLDKAAKILEGKFPEKAISMYERAAEVVMLEDRPKEASEFLGKAARLLVLLKRYDEAAERVKKELNYYLQSTSAPRAAGRLVIALVLIHLTRDDSVAAKKAFNEGGGYMEPEEQSTISQLLEGVEEGDPSLVTSALDNPFIKHMDTEYAKLARTLYQKESAYLAKTSGESSAAAAANKEEDYEDGAGLL